MKVIAIVSVLIYEWGKTKDYPGLQYIWRRALAVSNSPLQFIHARAYGELESILKVIDILVIGLMYTWRNNRHPKPVNRILDSYPGSSLSLLSPFFPNLITVGFSFDQAKSQSEIWDGKYSLHISPHAPLNLEFPGKESNTKCLPTSPHRYLHYISILFRNVHIQDQTLLPAVPYRPFSRAAYSRKEFQLQFKQQYHKHYFQ